MADDRWSPLRVGKMKLREIVAVFLEIYGRFPKQKNEAYSIIPFIIVGATIGRPLQSNKIFNL